MAFLMVTLWARKSKARGFRVTTILDTIAKDATWYFMVIFTSHFVLVMTLNLGRVSVAVSLCTATNYTPLRIPLANDPTASGHVSILHCLRLTASHHTFLHHN